MRHYPERIEALLADALAAHDSGGPAALASFLAGLGSDRGPVEKGLARCRQLGLLGDGGAAHDTPEHRGE